jgi:hypothetical protein
LQFIKALSIKTAKSEKDAQDWERVKPWYQDTLDILRRDGFSPTMAEAVYLRQVIKECLDDDDRTERIERETSRVSMDVIVTHIEIFFRFFINYYGINITECLKNIKPKHRQQAKRDLYKDIQEKLRKDRELI